MNDELKEYLRIIEEDEGWVGDTKVFSQQVEGDWLDDGKYANREDIWLHIEQERYFSVYNTRSGSYFTDYEYQDTTIYEVKPVMITTTVYQKI